MTKEGHWEYLETNPDTGRKYYRWEKGKKKSNVPVSPEIAPEESLVEQDLLTAEQLVQKQQELREKKFEEYQKNRPDLYED